MLCKIPSPAHVNQIFFTVASGVIAIIWGVIAIQIFRFRNGRNGVPVYFDGDGSAWGIARALALLTRLILTHPVTAVLAFVATDLGLPTTTALLGRWATFLSTAEVAFRTALLARPYTATDAGILATLLGPRGPAADIGLLAAGGRGTAAFARRGAILPATLAAGH